MNWKGESWRGFDGHGPCSSGRPAGLLMRPVTKVQQGDLAESLKHLVMSQETDKRDHQSGKALSPYNCKQSSDSNNPAAQRCGCFEMKGKPLSFKSRHNKHPL